MIEKQLLQITREFFPSSSIDINEWQSVLEQCKKDISIYHLFSTTEYFVAYYSKNNAINLSIILYDNKKAVGIMPLITYQNLEQEWVLSSNGVEIVEPIFIQNLPRKVKNRIEVKLHDLILELTRKLKIKQCQFTNMDYFQLSSWYLIWANTATEIFSTHHLLVDLSLPIDQIRLKFRKSFKPLVNKAIREWVVEVHNHPSEELFEEFRLLHRKVAGKVTRPIDSWRIQKKQIDLAESFIVTVHDKLNTMIGCGLFVYSGYQGMYSVGAYKRELFDKPIGHAVQMRAIESLKQKGCLWYEIGQKHLAVDKIKPTDKELSISHFKEGFSTRIVARQHLIVKIYS